MFPFDSVSFNLCLLIARQAFLFTGFAVPSQHRIIPSPPVIPARIPFSGRKVISAPAYHDRNCRRN